ncbi:Uncharacterised protein [uncultured archaeon]|nr:Uncharacterised protein [uncultured archaeon]
MQRVVDLGFSSLLILFLLCFVILNYAIIAMPAPQPAGFIQIIGGSGPGSTNSPGKPPASWSPKTEAITQDYG